MSTIAYSFVQSNDPIGRIIQAYERGPWSHVDCVMPDGTLLGARSDSVGGVLPGVQIRPPNYEVWPARDIVEIECSQFIADSWAAFLRRQIGKPYDTIDLLGDFLAGRDWRNPDAWWCSELGAAAGEASLWLPKPIGQAVSFITPRDWYIIVTPWRK